MEMRQLSCPILCFVPIYRHLAIIRAHRKIFATNKIDQFAIISNHTISEFEPYRNEVSLFIYEIRLLSELYSGNKTTCEIPRSSYRRDVNSGSSDEM